MRAAPGLSRARLLARYRIALVRSFVLSVLQALLLLPVALIVRRIFDDLVPHRDVGAILLSGAAIMGLYLGSAILGLWSRHLALKVTKAALTELRYMVLERVFCFPKAYIDRTRSGTLHSRIVWDTERVDDMSYALVSLASSIPIALGFCAVLLVLNPLLFLGLLCVVPVVMGISRLLGRRVRGLTKTWQAALDRFSAQTQVALRAVTLMKVHSAESIELARRKPELEHLADASRRMAWLQGAYVQAEGTIAASAGVVVLMIGGVAVAQHRMSLGEFLSFYAVVALLLRQVQVILTNAPSIMSGDEALQRLNQLLETDEPEPYRGRREIHFRGSLALEDVSFGYGEETLLNHVTLCVEPGERIALVGPNGAGKSTELSLILGLYRPRTGRLSADGVPYDDLDLRTLRRQIGVVLQDSVILPASVRANVAYGSPDATDQDVLRAMHWATADFVESLPAGLDTDVGDEGELLSGGQRQRIAIARALLRNPPLLIFDEPTTHLDDSSLVRLMQNLRAFPGEPGMLLITHDPAVAREVDTVYELRDGRIAADDTAVSPGRLRIGLRAST
jgi:ABC-type multidrug transport system fused ATPase/permease subunit